MIDNEALGARSVYVVDLDDDGNLDVLAASVDDDTVSWYQHDGNGNFTQQIIDDFADGAYGVFAADVDGDGLTDVLSASRDDFTVAWYRQSREPNASPEVTNPITDLIIPNELGTQTVDLSNFFADPDGDQITFSVESNSNTELVTTVLDGSNLNLDILDGQLGTAEITVRAAANGQFIDETFTVTIDDSNSEGNLLNSPIYRFQSNITLGTFLYVQEEERVSINQNSNDSFFEEGIAFNAAIEPDDELITLFRFQNNQMPGTYLYVGEAERDSINMNPNLANNFTDEGIAFYAYGIGAGKETPFYRFQNSEVPGTYIYATGTEAITIRADFPNYIEEGIAFEARI